MNITNKTKIFLNTMNKLFFDEFHFLESYDLFLEDMSEEMIDDINTKLHIELSQLYLSNLNIDAIEKKASIIRKDINVIKDYQKKPAS